ncbi:helix-turn-helix domain-containing protein [Mucilaginibacter sp. X4EP1]|uniref:helix-turn-helix domain-containing protein n=1 Tax=Mucilaginibacter sp. X4EP1 TaxID=2723092 RepID=UPI002168CD80|nr:helix-turn-helix transcriptional regulator [Mucilaginibacter sp. X4EP1]MCS3811586.1 AraC-like DNA-binding protein [Mucilaginibacter sp. X4EP1]
MAGTTPIRIKTITEFHRLNRLPGPLHPLISLVNYADIRHPEERNGMSAMFDFYSISVKRGLNYKMVYGQQPYDFDEGILFFLAPGQVLRVETDESAESKPSGWLLLVHPDFLANTALAKEIRQYGYFGYAVNEALFLSEREEVIMNGLVEHIRQELMAFTDRFSQQIIVSELAALLGYGDRFYHRQFITRDNSSKHRVLERLEILLNNYFSSQERLQQGIPTVQFVAEKLNMSPNYLSGLLKALTGLNTQQHIHEQLIAVAKQKLSATDLTVSEIAYSLGFEHVPSFSKLFKQKTRQSPVAFRRGFQKMPE